MTFSASPSAASAARQRIVPVVEQERLARDTYRLRLAAPELAEIVVPGQFFMIRSPGIVNPLLGRPFALYDTWLGPDGRPAGRSGLKDAKAMSVQECARQILAATHARKRQLVMTLQDELTTRLAEETNRRLYIVSVVTVLFIPATFVTGFFGMNTGGLLWGGDGAPHGTWFAAVACFGAVLVTLLLLRSKRML